MTDPAPPPLLVETIAPAASVGTRLPVGVGAEVGEHPPELALRGAIAAALVLADQQQNTLIAAMLDACLAAAGGHL